MYRITLYVSKFKVFCIIFIMCIILSCYNGFSQYLNGNYVNYYEYIQFINDTVVKFRLFGGIMGSLKELQYGIGKYKIKNSQLSISITKDSIFNLSIGEDLEDSCSLYFKKLKNGIFIYKIEILSNDTIKLIGPILDNYHKLNRKRFFVRFINSWPWKWSFRKQHWYDPIERLLYKQ